MTASDATAAVLGGLGVNGTLLIVGAATWLPFSPLQLLGGRQAIKGWYFGDLHRCGGCDLVQRADQRAP